MPAPIEDQPQEDSRRDQLSAMFDAAEQGAEAEASQSAEQQDAGRARDESGRFAPKASEVVAPAPVSEVAPVAQAAPVAPAAPSLTTWRKEYLPIQEKLASGMPLTPDEAKKLAEYNVQREREYSTGVSTHRAEAEKAKQFTGAMAEFMPDLQRAGIEPTQWIQNLGRAHKTLAMGSPEQKLDMFLRLAHDYGVPLGAVTQAQQTGQVDQTTLQMMRQMDEMRNSVQGMTSWRAQQEQQEVQQVLAKFQDATKYPHFANPAVQGKMAQLLETGFAQDPDEAYQKAIRLDDDVWTAELQRQAAATASMQQSQRAAVVSKAKAASGQVRSAAPSSTASAQPSTKDRRASIAASFDAIDAGRV